MSFDIIIDTIISLHSVPMVALFNTNFSKFRFAFGNANLNVDYKEVEDDLFCDLSNGKRPFLLAIQFDKTRRTL